eukprot:7160601-Pyramimonas_sp.AAC.1
MGYVCVTRAGGKGQLPVGPIRHPSWRSHPQRQAPARTNGGVGPRGGPVKGRAGVRGGVTPFGRRPSVAAPRRLSMNCTMTKRNYYARSSGDRERRRSRVIYAFDDHDRIVGMVAVREY